MLRWRLLLGAIFIAAAVGLMWLDDRAPVAGAWLLPVAVVLAALAADETQQLAAQAGLRPTRWLVDLGAALVVAGPWLAPFAGRLSDRPSLDLSVAVCGAVVLAIFVAEMRRYREPGGVTANLAAAVFALVYAGLMTAILAALRLSYGVGALATLVITVKAGDTGAYTVGRLIGRHKLCPSISPGKTVEGAFGHVAFACLGAWASLTWLVPLTQTAHDSVIAWWQWLVFGAVVGTAGMLGDLAESLLKRDVGRKDSSVWLPGFGGVLDILDSLLLAAPVGWLCWVLVIAR